MKLTIIIVNYNVKVFLEQALHSVFQAMDGIKAEVFVVDNRSVDGSVEMIREKFPNVQLIENKENVGFSKANNQAIEMANGEYVLLLNPDTVVQEDTFQKCIAFMDATKDAGGLGVKMYDGNGKFLPESKRALPTPSVAFYKVFGLSSLFPKSKLFGKYHLGYLNRDETHSVEVLSGAFMFIRKSVLDKIGLLDEDFFMYGEDIDLSYRITQAGYKNYYFPETQIIHFKGESTKKSSINYVLVFYKAMVIFAKKHFSQSNAGIFSILINLAIYLRASFAILARLFKAIAYPLSDALLLYGGMYILKVYWENNHKFVLEPYKPELMQIAVPSYIACWLLGVYISGGYDKPLKMSRIWRGLLWGSLAIVVMYAFVSMDYRFSRALVILGSFWSFIAISSSRIFVNLIKNKRFNFSPSKRLKVGIVGSPEEGEKALKMIQHLHENLEFVGYISPSKLHFNPNTYLGKIQDLKELLRIYQLNEIIFCSDHLSAGEMIEHMGSLEQPGVQFRIVPKESEFILGGEAADQIQSLYSIDVQLKIQDPIQKRAKRMLDVLAALLFLLLSPILIFIQKSIPQFYKNILLVLLAKKSWVGYSNQVNSTALPTIKKGVLNPTNAVAEKIENTETMERLNLLYARHYRIENDIIILFRSLSYLSNN